MMFKIAAKPTFEATAKVHVAGQEQPSEIKLTFKYLNKTDFEEWFKSKTNVRTAEALNDIIIDWDVLNEQGEKVPYSLDNLKALADQLHTVEQDILTAYTRELYGARRKN